jgi:hypothetical protein
LLGIRGLEIGFYLDFGIWDLEFVPLVPFRLENGSMNPLNVQFSGGKFKYPLP